MVVPLFGWSAGDVVTSIQILCAVACAFKEATGAKSQYADTATWLESFASDLERMKEYITENPEARYTKNIVEQVGRVDKHYALFETYLQKFDKGLSSTGDANTITTSIKKVKWTLKELKGKVDSLKFAVTGPIVSLNLLLALQFRVDLSTIATKVTNMPPTPRIRDLDNAFQGVHDRIQMLQDIQARLKADLTDEHVMIKDELSHCISETSTKILESHRDATAQVISIIDAKDTSWKEAISTMREHLYNIGEEQLRTQRFQGELRAQQRKLSEIRKLLDKVEPFESSVKDLHSELAALASKSHGSTLLEMTQAVGVAGSLIAGLGNMLLINKISKMISGVREDFHAFKSSNELAHLLNTSQIQCIAKDDPQSETLQELPSYPFELSSDWKYRGWAGSPVRTGGLEIPDQIMKMFDYLLISNSPQDEVSNYFLPSDGIHHDVLRTDASLYLAQPALIWPKVNMGIHGYLIKASTCFTEDMIGNLKEDSIRWSEFLDKNKHKFSAWNRPNYMSYDIFKGRWQPLRAAIQQKLNQEAEEKAKMEKEQRLERERKQREEDERRKKAQNTGDSWASSFREGLSSFDTIWNKGGSGGGGDNPPGSVPPSGPPPPPGGGGVGGGGRGGGRGGGGGGSGGGGAGAAAANHGSTYNSRSNRVHSYSTTTGSQSFDGPIKSKLDGGTPDPKWFPEPEYWTPRASTPHYTQRTRDLTAASSSSQSIARETSSSSWEAAHQPSVKYTTSSTQANTQPSTSTTRGYSSQEDSGSQTEEQRKYLEWKASKDAENRRMRMTH